MSTSTSTNAGGYWLLVILVAMLALPVAIGYITLPAAKTPLAQSAALLP